MRNITAYVMAWIGYKFLVVALKFAKGEYEEELWDWVGKDIFVNKRRCSISKKVKKIKWIMEKCGR